MYRQSLFLISWGCGKKFKSNHQIKKGKHGAIYGQVCKSVKFISFFFQMGILLATANFDIFLDKTESAQRSTDSEDSENPLYRFVSTEDHFFFWWNFLCEQPQNLGWSKDGRGS